jgi:hypothetical protein
MRTTLAGRGRFSGGETRIDVLIEEAVGLQNELVIALRWHLNPDSPRTRLSRVLALIAFEHGSGLLELTRTAKYTSAIGLLRLQYEALVRSVWLLRCATEAEVQRLSDEARVGTNQQLPAVVAMLDALNGVAPDSLVKGLVEFRDSSWKPLSSYVHGGIHAVRWTETGFPRPLLQQALKACDGLLVFTAMHLGVLSGDLTNSLSIVDVATRHSACLPPHRGSGSAG